MTEHSQQRARRSTLLCEQLRAGADTASLAALPALSVGPRGLAIVLDRLSQPVGAWQPLNVAAVAA